MKKWLLILSTVFAVFSAECQDHLNVVTFNIRVDVPSDSLNNWAYRKDNVASQVLFHDTHILGVQEALENQMVDLQERLKGFAHAGVSRDSNERKGEYSA